MQIRSTNAVKQDELNLKLNKFGQYELSSLKRACRAITILIHKYDQSINTSKVKGDHLKEQDLADFSNEPTGCYWKIILITVVDIKLQSVYVIIIFD